VDWLQHWWRIVRAGYQAPVALASFIVLVVGGSVLLAIPWGHKHLLWGISALLAGVIVLILVGSYRESVSLAEKHEKELGRLRAEHQAELNKALVAALPAGGAAVSPDDWDAYCDFSPPDSLMFNLRHRYDNPAARLEFSELRCEVTDPSRVRTVATGTAIYYQYHPYYFPGAPPVRNGTYRFTWHGLDRKGNWQKIKDGSCEVTGATAAG